jgi:hypothetical protein
VDSVKGLVEQILQYGRVIRPVLGIVSKCGCMHRIFDLMIDCFFFFFFFPLCLFFFLCGSTAIMHHSLEARNALQNSATYNTITGGN